MNRPQIQLSRFTRSFILFAAIAASAFLSGCFTKDRDESQIPWARPASWEGGMPGMGGMPGSGY